MKRSFGVFFLLSFPSPPPPPLEKEKGVKFVTSELFFLPTRPHPRCDAVDDGKFVELRSLQIV